MPDWLQEAVSVTPMPAEIMALRLGLSVLFGAAVALVYRISHGRHARDARTLTATLVLLCILLAMVSMVIGESIARAFGLVGALSIVRFRTIVEDTRDTAFVIFAVIVGMAVGTGLILVPLIGVPMVGVAALAMSRGGSPAPSAGETVAGPQMHLTIRVGIGPSATSGLEGVLDRTVASHRLIGVATARQGAAVDATYAVTLSPVCTAIQLIQQFNALDGVQSVELNEMVHDR